MRAILTYHSVDDSGSPISVSPAAFAAHHRWLTGGAVPVEPLETLLRETSLQKDAIAVTFDDGFENVKEPVERLIDAGVTPTLFVVSKHIGGVNRWGGRDQPGIPTLPLLTWDDLGRLHSRGASIEAHTRSHPHLTGLSPGQLQDELEGCREDLRSELGVTSTVVAYPYGDVDPTVADRASAWFAFGVTVEMRPIDTQSQAMLFPRLDMYYYREPHSMESWGTAPFAARLAGIRLRRRIKAMLPGR